MPRFSLLKSKFFTPRQAVLAQWSLLEVLRDIPANQLGRAQPAEPDSQPRSRRWSGISKAWKVLEELTVISFIGIPERLHALGERMQDLYHFSHDTTHLEQAIRLLQLAAGLLGKEREGTDLSLSDCLNDLGGLFAEMYFATRALGDLDEAIRLGREAIELSADDEDQYLAEFRHDAAGHLLHRYHRTQSSTDLNQAEEQARTAIALTSDDKGLDMADRLITLGAILIDRFAEHDDGADLEQGIQYLQNSIDYSGDDNMMRAKGLFQLSRLYQVKYEYGGEHIADLEQAIQITKQVLETVPKSIATGGLGHWASTLSSLADLLYDRYKLNGCTDGLEEIARQMESAMHMPERSIMDRVVSGMKAVGVYMQFADWPRAQETSEATMDLFSKLTPRSLENADMQEVLSAFRGFVSNAAAIALQTDQGPLAALRLLEQGRGVIGASVLGVQTDLAKLQERHPKLATKFKRLQDQIEASSGDGSTVHTRADFKKPRGLPPHTRHHIAASLEGLISKIRQEQDFERFMLIPTVEEMQAAAEDGPIVLINATDFRSDAIIIERHQVRSLPLPRLNVKEINDLLENFAKWSAFLAWLWDSVSFPVLEALGFYDAPSDPETLPRMWWIPTGALGFIPFHAAGHHLNRPTDAVLDKVVSSYSPSVRAIIDNRRRRGHTPSAQDEVVLLAMKDTLGFNPLPYITREVEEVKNTCRELGLKIVEPPPRRSRVMESLQRCTIFHFAGHSNADILDPLQSYLVLEDWSTRRFTVDDLLRLKFGENPPFLAYLSACGTAQVYDETYHDEGMHLANAFQLAGFRHVIGSLWEVRDMACADMARITYESIRADNATDQSVSRGLHKATRMLRDDWARDIILTGEERSRTGVSSPLNMSFGRRNDDDRDGTYPSRASLEKSGFRQPLPLEAVAASTPSRM
ncbi:hypothetical protein F5Y16DRAFT_410580 [Xylariaceae sp. FL0255]|nr:hypothetical protein F5Y16DRAFT_410580 [Xylariaceae sp. FL0255]